MAASHQGVGESWNSSPHYLVDSDLVVNCDSEDHNRVLRALVMKALGLMKCSVIIMCDKLLCFGGPMVFSQG